jgi:predicted dehydrogenase
MNRRSFLLGSAAVLAATSVGSAKSPEKKFRAAIIGHTGRGNYGHGLDIAFTDRADCEVVAVADPVEAGRVDAAKRSKAQRHYADYREMLAKEKPDLVAIGPRHTDQHVAMALAAFDAGAHVLMEKPIAASPAESDEIFVAASRAKRKIAVAHQMRLAPRIVALQKSIREGLIGDLLQMDAWGKQDDKRAGGEDMMVLGTHLFDLLRLFAGDPQWCTARVLQNGRDITPSDAHPASEPIGPIAGNEVFAQLAFPDGVNATFTSRAKMREYSGVWGIELIGSKGSVRLLTEVEPQVLMLKAGQWSPAGRTDTWRPPGGKPGAAGNFTEANRRIVDDLIEAIKADREPACSGRNAAMAVEMVIGVYHAALSAARVKFPLTDRRHPLS